MTFTSTLYYLAIDPTNKQYEETCYNSEDPVYVWKDGTVYMRKGVWDFKMRNWLECHGIETTDVENRYFYLPVATIKEGVLIGYATEHANIANRFLDMSKSTREEYYPNLYYVELGMHPYPKEGRYHQGWAVSNYHRECHRIVYPDPDPKKHFFRLSQLLP